MLSEYVKHNLACCTANILRLKGHHLEETG
jgi:hypothetical protein